MKTYKNQNSKKHLVVDDDIHFAVIVYCKNRGYSLRKWTNKALNYAIDKQIKP